VHDASSPFWAWQSANDWGPALAERLKNAAVRCEFPDEKLLTDDALRLTAREIDEVAVSEATTRFTLYANQGPPARAAATTGELDAFKRGEPDAELWSPTMEALCSGAPTCHLGAADPAVFDEHCTTQGNQTMCSKQYFSIWYWFQRTGAYYKPLQLQSQIAFTIKK
jgi:hypothetical protein